MTQEQAQKIIYDEYAEFLQSDQQRFEFIFFGSPDIPPMLFPYSKEYLEKALDIVLKYYKDKSDFNQVKLLNDIAPTLWMHSKTDNEVMNLTLENLEKKEGWDMTIKAIKGFQNGNVQSGYISRSLDGESINNIDFDNLDIKIADKLLNIWFHFMEYSYFRLLYLFNFEMPESLLPFSKEKIIKLFDFYIQNCVIEKNPNRFKNYYEMRTYLNKCCIDDEKAMKGFVENISDNETKDSIFAKLLNHQTEKINKLL